MTDDVLSDVLAAVHLTGTAYFDLDLRAPWVAESPAAREVAAVVMPGSDHVLEYHLVARGAAWAQTVGGEPIRLSEGDVILFPRGDAHVLSSAPGMRGKPDLSLFVRGSSPLPLSYAFGGDGLERTRLVCCFLGCDERPYNPLLASLPAVIHLSAARDGAGSGWLATLMGIAAAESGTRRPGVDNVLGRLAELMFVEAIRRHLEALPPAGTGWLVGLRDPVVGKALAVLHARPRDAWTVELLAREAAVSRSVLAERFTEMVGTPPMEYLALWRMQLASRVLAGGGSVAAAGEAAGYASEAAFGRAFRRLVGASPAAWRRGSRA